jgi:primosomal replication protein N''
MVYLFMTNFSQLQVHVEQMSHQAEILDKKRGEHHLPLFDERLFRCKSHLLTPCVNELSETLATLVLEHKSGRLTDLRAQYLSEKLGNQFTAVQRELSTAGLRKDEPKHYYHKRKSINTLYQELAQHQDWERRLQVMLSDKKHEIANASFHNSASLQQAAIALEQRLERCQASKVKLENSILYRERHQ